MKSGIIKFGDLLFCEAYWPLMCRYHIPSKYIKKNPWKYLRNSSVASSILIFFSYLILWPDFLHPLVDYILFSIKKSVSVWCQATLHTLSDIEKLLWMPHATEVSAKLEFLTHRHENQNKIIITKHWDLGRILFYKKIITKIELKHNPLLQVNCLH